MENSDLPPSYSEASKEPPAPQQNQGYPGQASLLSPTFEPPYMSASAPPQPMLTTVTVSGVRGAHVPGSCPVCSNTSWTGTYSCLAWFLCFFCFWNCGLCCCLCMRKKKCTKCGFTIN